MTENFRPVQPLGDRPVYYNVGERPVQSRITDGDDSSGGGRSPSSPAFNFILAFYLVVYLVTR